MPRPRARDLERHLLQGNSSQRARFSQKAPDRRGHQGRPLRAVRDHPLARPQAQHPAPPQERGRHRQPDPEFRNLVSQLPFADRHIRRAERASSPQEPPKTGLGSILRSDRARRRIGVYGELTLYGGFRRWLRWTSICAGASWRWVASWPFSSSSCCSSRAAVETTSPRPSRPAPARSQRRDWISAHPRAFIEEADAICGPANLAGQRDRPRGYGRSAAGVPDHPRGAQGAPAAAARRADSNPSTKFLNDLSAVVTALQAKAQAEKSGRCRSRGRRSDRDRHRRGRRTRRGRRRRLLRVRRSSSTRAKTPTGGGGGGGRRRRNHRHRRRSRADGHHRAARRRTRAPRLLRTTAPPRRPRTTTAAAAESPPRRPVPPRRRRGARTRRPPRSTRRASPPRRSSHARAPRSSPLA